MSAYKIELDEASKCLRIVPTEGHEHLPTAICRLNPREDGIEDDATTVELDSGTSNVIGMSGEDFNELSARIKRANMAVSAAHGDLDQLRQEFAEMA